MSTANKVILRCLCATFCSLLLLGRTSPVNAGVLFSDDFNRSDNVTVGNGWTEVDGGSLNSSIESNYLKMSQGSSGDTQDTRIYRATIEHNDIVISGTLRMTGMSGGARQNARVVVRSNGTEGVGFCTNTNTGAIGYVPCGNLPLASTCPLPGCWKGDGYGFAIMVDQGRPADIQIVDDGNELANLLSFPFFEATTYQ